MTSCACQQLNLLINLDVPFSAAILEQGVPLDCLDGNAKSFQTYESNVLFALRFMVDTDIVGGNWVRCSACMCCYYLMCCQHSDLGPVLLACLQSCRQ
jgi:DNA polymerase family B, exonuclease domain